MRLRYPLPQLRVIAQQRSVPTVYFCLPDYDVPSGGFRVVYRHVDILNEAGIPAAVLHCRAGFRCTWFENQTRVVGSRSSSASSTSRSCAAQGPEIGSSSSTRTRT